MTSSTTDYERLSELDIAAETKQELKRTLDYSAAAFAAACTNQLQGLDARSAKARDLKKLLEQVLAPDSATSIRDCKRVAAVAAAFRTFKQLLEHAENTPPLVVLSANADTRLWLARRLCLALDLSPYPDNSGVFDVAADPAAGKEGQIIIVAPQHEPLAGDTQCLDYDALA